MIQTHQICKSWQDRTLFSKISFTFEQGICYGILGPNGSGKTTLLRCLSGELTPDEGMVTLIDKPILSFSPRQRARKIGVLSQESFYDLPFTVEEMVMMGRYPYQRRWPWDNEIDYQSVRAMMTELDVESLAQMPFSSLSGGEKQRVLITRLLVQEASILLLDEPMNHLDIQHQIRFLELIQEIRDQQNMTIIIVLHDLNIAAQFCDRLLFLADGKLLATGTAEELYTADLIKQVYQVDPIIVKHPTLKVPQVFMQLSQNR
ncbi:iron complex transport system ATP-binding protein [Seinonella peptonophila]|uniref:Iron complex transport system ATP-binding protein n=1 Tax=Seinonella peptonophila TaxID=112248 RepID=A0A1M5AJC6_9BACL|nr:ABC transporter ATP-binding protein [Seinonella peptonophila]SHF30012.1 iron complex transport system ATP-binding protein [Seinonella peptonophila]